jgi:hypothetical protein
VELCGTLGLQKNVSALKERQISAYHKPAIEREIEIANAGQKRLAWTRISWPIDSAIRSSAPLFCQDGLSAEIVFQHFAETATLCRL